jgi:hypothetical protein
MKNENVEIEDLKKRVLHLEDALKVRKLYDIPIKYRKMFPETGKSCLFDTEKFKYKGLRETFPTYELKDDGIEPEWPLLNIAIDPEELKQAKEELAQIHANWIPKRCSLEESPAASLKQGDTL